MPVHRSTDDPLYRIHGRLLGFRGSDGRVYKLPIPLAYTAIGPFLAVLVVTRIILSLFGASGLWGWLWALLAAAVVTAVILKVTGPERPMSVVLQVLLHEVSAPRPQAKPMQAARLDVSAVPVSPSRLGRKGQPQ
jgi:hypothetical protein